MEIILFIFGGRLYTWLEMAVRGRTHWTMFMLGGICFVIMGLLNEHIFPWDMSLVAQSIVSAVVITILEFVTGCVVNLWLGWQIWDYSDIPFNLCGQICLVFSVAWCFLSTIGIILDDWIRFLLYAFLHKYLPGMQAREKPHYTLIGGKKL